MGHRSSQWEVSTTPSQVNLRTEGTRPGSQDEHGSGWSRQREKSQGKKKLNRIWPREGEGTLVACDSVPTCWAQGTYGLDAGQLERWRCTSLIG